MDVQECERFRSQLAEAGFPEGGARYEESAFGIVVRRDRDPRLRVLWDGKSGSLVIQREATAGRWEDLAVTSSKADQTAEALTQALAGL